MKGKVLIVSQPKSGSTALFYKLRQAMPMTTKTFFEPTDLAATAAQLTGTKSALCKYLVTPWNAERKPEEFACLSSFDKVIVLHRDPRDFMVSAFLYSFFEANAGATVFGMSHALAMIERKQADPKSLPFLDMVAIKNALERGDHISADLENFQVMYDRFGNELDLRRHPLETAQLPRSEKLRALLKTEFSERGFLHYVQSSMRTLLELKRYVDCRGIPVFSFPYSDLVEGNLDHLSDYLGGKLKSETKIDKQHKRVIRTKSQGDWRNWLTRSDFDWLAPMFRDYMQTFGYPDDWEEAEHPTIPPEHGSDYVYRLFRERHDSNPVLNLQFDRDTLRRLSTILEDDTRPEPAYLPALQPLRTQYIGDDSVAIEDTHVTTPSGQRVNVLVPGQQYVFSYTVDASSAHRGVSFWMQVTNQNGMPVFNGTSFTGRPTREQLAAGERLQISFPFRCDFRRGLYYFNAGITHAPGGVSEVLRRHVMTSACLVKKMVEHQWVRPEIKELESRA